MVEYRVRVNETRASRTPRWLKRQTPDKASFGNLRDAHDWAARRHPGKRYRIESIGPNGTGTGMFTEYDPR